LPLEVRLIFDPTNATPLCWCGFYESAQSNAFMHFSMQLEGVDRINKNKLTDA
jgi:hypothetical protein